MISGRRIRVYCRGERNFLGQLNQNSICVPSLFCWKGLENVGVFRAALAYNEGVYHYYYRNVDFTQYREMISDCYIAL